MLPPVIVVPGITATGLTDFYPPDPEGRWGIVRKDYERVALHPDDLRYEQIEPALMRAGEVFGIPYDEYVRELRHELSPARDQPRPVFLFHHDWRQPIEAISEQLALFADEVIARTALLKHYARAGYTREAGRVDLVGHSMGGLVISGYLSARGAAHRARKVITLGTPFGGSFEAVLKIIVGTSGLDSGVPKARERETARVTPALYYLLPRDGHVHVESGPSELPKSLFEAELWQHNVTETLAQHIELYSNRAASTKAGRREQARAMLQEMLDSARKFLTDLDALSLDELGLDENDWMAIVGIGEKTRVRLEIEDQGKSKGPWYDLRSLDRRNGYPMPTVDEATGTVIAEVWDTGDGTVPYFSAEPPFLSPSKLIGVSGEDFGYWEIGDRLIEWATNLHSMLPSMNRVIKLSVQFLRADAGEKARGHRGIRGRRAPGCIRDGLDWEPPFEDLEEEEPEGWGGLVTPGR